MAVRQDKTPVTVRVVFDSRGGLTERLADSIAEGARSVAGSVVYSDRIHETRPGTLRDADAIILGSPNWSGITGALKEWFDQTGEAWETGWLSGKVGAAFTAGYSRSGGTEATLLQIMHLLLANGLIFVGLPWSDTMRTSGSYYGATAHGEVGHLDQSQARALGERVATVAAGVRRGKG